VVGSGELVDGRYRLEYIVGAGGMGVVWAATHERLDRKVALKQIPLGARRRPRRRHGRLRGQADEGRLRLLQPPGARRPQPERDLRLTSAPGPRSSPRPPRASCPPPPRIALTGAGYGPSVTIDRM